MSQQAPPAVAAFTPDLMDRSKIMAAVPDARFVAAPEALVGLAGIDIIVVDLRQPRARPVLSQLAGSGSRVVAYGSHVDRDVLAEAQAAGAEVYPRSQFFARLAELLT